MNTERFLKLFLRVVGFMAALAAFCVLMPYAWMDAVHRLAGMGGLPNYPIVGYLARSTSAFYALFGILYLILSFDLSRYRPLVRFMGGATFILGVTLFVVDRVEGMPLFWRLGEGPIDMTIGAVILLLSRSSRDGQAR